MTTVADQDAAHGAPLSGLSGLYGAPAQPTEMTGRPAENWGTGPDPRHDVSGAAGSTRPYSGSVYAGQITPGADVAAVALPGLPGNATPDRHSAPYPTGVTQDPLVAAAQMRTLHGLDLGGPAATVTDLNTPGEEPLTSDRYDSPNASVLAGTVPAQLRSGSDDVDQGDGAEHGFGFEFGRQFRRFFHTRVPLDRTGTVHAERPFYGHHPVSQATFDTDSPYGAAGDTTRDMGMRDTRTGFPTPYEQPANPTYLPTATPAGEAGYSDGWTAG